MSHAALARQPMSAMPRDPNLAWLQRILSAQREGRSCLPLHLGLAPQTHAALIQACFPERAGQYLGAPPQASERDALRVDCADHAFALADAERLAEVLRDGADVAD